MSAVVWILLTVLAVIIGAEFLAWSASLHRLIIRRAVAALPIAHRARYIEEWYGELERSPDGPITRLIFAADLFIKRGGMARDLRASGDPRVEAAAEDARERLNRRNFRGEQAYRQAIEAVSRSRFPSS